MMLLEASLRFEDLDMVSRDSTEALNASLVFDLFFSFLGLPKDGKFSCHEAPGGELVAIVGGVGSGKSALLQAGIFVRCHCKCPEPGS